MRHKKRIPPCVTFVGPTFNAATLVQVHGFIKITLFVARQYKTFRSKSFNIITPDIFPVIGLPEIFFSNIVFIQPFCNLSNAKIIECILHSPAARSFVISWNIAYCIVIWQTSPSLFLLVFTRRNSCIFNHRLQAFLVIYSFQSFSKCIGNQHIGITSTLCHGIRVATPCIRHIAFVFINIKQSIHNINLLTFID